MNRDEVKKKFIWIITVSEETGLSGAIRPVGSKPMEKKGYFCGYGHFWEDSTIDSNDKPNLVTKNMNSPGSLGTDESFTSASLGVEDIDEL
jgi:hypothetical protein